MSISQTCRHTDVHPYVHLHIISTSNIPATPWHSFWPKHRSKQQQVGHYIHGCTEFSKESSSYPNFVNDQPFVSTNRGNYILMLTPDR